MGTGDPNRNVILAPSRDPFSFDQLLQILDGSRFVHIILMCATGYKIDADIAPNLEWTLGAY